MSIPGAVAELNKEIERLTKIRDSLLVGSPAGMNQPAVPTKRRYTRSAKTAVKTQVKSSAPAKKTTAKKSASVKTAAPAKKRVVSPATRKKMSDAAKARAATKTETAK